MNPYAMPTYPAEALYQMYAPAHYVGQYPQYYVGDAPPTASEPQPTGTLETPWKDVLLGTLAGALLVLVFKRFL